jgi:SAM-dependent methyltransferase
MMPTRDEFLVLAACDALARSGQASFRPGELESGALKLSEGKPCEPAGAIESLARRGWLLPSESSADYTLSGEAAIVAKMAGTDEVSPALFNEWLTRSAASPAYLRFCDKVYGTPFVEFDMVDREQLEYFIEKAGPGPGLRVLDLGCGIGSQAEYISDMTGADVTGVDYADQAVEVARKRCASRADRLHFAVGNLDGLDPSLGLFDIIVSFDTLYFVKDLSKSLSDIMGHLAPGGRFYAFFTDGPGRDDPEGRAPATPDASKLGTMLSGMGLRFEALDFSANEEVLWAKSLEWAEKLRPDFEAEGCLDLYWGRVIESNECVSLWRDGKLRRWLFVAEAPGPSISG